MKEENLDVTCLAMKAHIQYVVFTPVHKLQKATSFTFRNFLQFIKIIITM